MSITARRKSLIPILGLAAGLASPVWGVDPDLRGHGTAPSRSSGADLSDEQRAAIQAELARNVAALREQGILPQPSEAALATHATLIWPVRAPGLQDPDFHALWVFVDHNAVYPNAVLDYNCGNRTYDRADGYNHQGTDYGIWPFEWLRMEQSVVEVVAAAPGVIVGKADGNPDHECTNPNLPWNAVYVQHADGSTTWYGHLKLGSVTTKAIGASVVAGERLGLVGSAGNSRVPHLHFEVYDSSGLLNDPYQGSCNNFNATSWWAVQAPYNDSGLNRLATGFAPPTFPPCPEVETPNETSDFNPTDRAQFVTYFRDQLAGQLSNNVVRRPDGTVFSTWTDNPTVAYQDATYWYRTFASFAPTGPLGVWRYDVTYQGKTYSRHFRVSAATGVGRVPGDLEDDPPLQLGKSGGDITMSWTASCVPTDTDYEVYEGTIGTWTSHAPKTCSTGGSTTATITPAAGSTYYLIVPTDTANEGSYGYTGAWAERPLGTSSCHTQVIGGSCPHCGDFRVEGTEVCDRTALNGHTCATEGFTGGELSCSPGCDAFDTTGCN